MPSVSCSESHHHLPGMAKTRSMRTRDAAPWSDLDHNVLFLVMMKLGVIDFLAFSGVCKAWRSVALNNRIEFMAPKLPMYLTFSDRTYKKTCFLEDYGGRKFKTILPHSAGRICVGVTCGYIILFGEKALDFWLVNPITGRQLHFPNVSFYVDACRVRAILVYSPSLSASVFVMTNLFDRELWISIEGKGAWNKVFSVNSLLDLHFYKGKIYTLYMTSYYQLWNLENIYELTLVPEPKLSIVETKNAPIRALKWEFISSDKNLYVVRFISERGWKIHKLDVGEMKWVSPENTTFEYALFLSSFKSSAAVDPSSWADCWSSTSAKRPESGKSGLNSAKMWYFPHDCCHVNKLEVL